MQGRFFSGMKEKQKYEVPEIRNFESAHFHVKVVMADDDASTAVGPQDNGSGYGDEP